MLAPPPHHSNTVFPGWRGWSVLNLSPRSPGVRDNWREGVGAHPVWAVTSAHSENWDFNQGLVSQWPGLRRWVITLSQECAGAFLLEQSELNSALWGHSAWHGSPRLSPVQASGVFPSLWTDRIRSPGSHSPAISVTEPQYAVSSFEGEDSTSYIFSPPQLPTIMYLAYSTCSVNTAWAVSFVVLLVLNFVLWTSSAGPCRSFSQILSTKQALTSPVLPWPLVPNYYFGFCSLWTV